MSNISETPGSVPGMGPLGQLSVEEQKAAINLMLASTLQQSDATQALVSFLMGSPSLIEPMDPATAKAIVGAEMSKIGSSIWDAYLENLGEQKERIREYMASPGYQNWLATKSTAGIAKMESGAIIDTPKEKIELLRDIVERLSAQGGQESKKSEPGTAVITAGFVISGFAIGDFMNVVDVVSTDMVAVNPIQSASFNVLPVMAPELQETLALTVNLFAMGLINFSNAQVVGGSMETGKPPVTKDAVLAFARNVIGKVTSNEVNYLIMAMLVNRMEGGEPITEGRMNQLAAMAKIILMGQALAILYVEGAGKMTDIEFVKLINGEIPSESNLESQLVQLSRDIKASGLISAGEWTNLVNALAKSFDGVESVDDLFNLPKVMGDLKPPQPAS